MRRRGRRDANEASAGARGKAIKPIETIYNGYRFRSRLEARWAVFFDVLGIEYEYEPEGFELGDGLRYLPDFYLPENDVWVEVKGKPADQIPDSELEKIIRFCDAKCHIESDGTRFRLLGQIPKPLPREFPGVLCWVYVSPYELQQMERKEVEKVSGGEIPDFVEVFPPTHGQLVPSAWVSGHSYKEISMALTKARQARFEHGETPKVR